MMRLSLRRTLVASAAACFAALAAGPAQAAVETYRAGDPNDPRIREARYLAEDKRYLSALIELQKVLQQVEAPRSPQYGWLLADSYLSFGLRDRATTYYNAIEKGGTSDPVQLARARLKLADFEYTRGYLPEARALLIEMREGLPKELLTDWQDLTARVLLRMDRTAEAIDVLTNEKNGSEQTPFTRYNLGIALIHDGRADQGRTVLEKVGKLDPTDRDTLGLRDLANLMLGWNFLQDKQGSAAKPFLRKVRVEGPYSNRALLGLGWAETTLDSGSRPGRKNVGDGDDSNQSSLLSFSTLGVLLRRGLVDDSKRRSFERAGSNSAEGAAMREALPAWLLLMDRDPQDPAVQEAWLAIPFVLEQMGAHEQAIQYYEQAAQRLEQARKRADLAITAIKTDRMIETIVKRDLDSESGWSWELKDLPDAPETYYLQTLIAEHRFAEGLKNYRDVRMLTRNLEVWDKRLAEVQKTFDAGDRASVDTRTLFRRANDRVSLDLTGPALAIRLDPHLAEPGHYKAPVDKVAPAVGGLKLSGAPSKFDGPFERLDGSRKRIASLRPLLVKAGAQQAAWLRQVGESELQAQKKQIEKYLVEARFALARLYDRPPTPTEPAADSQPKKKGQ